MELLIPPVNLTGTFKLKEPLTNMINEHIVYTVDSIKSISSLLDEEIDVLQLVYIEQGLTEENYLDALKSKIPIVVLKTEGNIIFNIPADYFITIPQIAGKIFINKAFIINVGYVPNDLDISYVTPEIQDLVTNLTGLETTASLEDISEEFVESYENYDTFESARNDRRNINDTCQFLLGKANETINTYKIKIKALITKIENLES